MLFAHCSDRKWRAEEAVVSFVSIIITFRSKVFFTVEENHCFKRVQIVLRAYCIRVIWNRYGMVCNVYIYRLIYSMGVDINAFNYSRFFSSDARTLMLCRIYDV